MPESKDATVGRPLSNAIAVVGLSQLVSTCAFGVFPQWNESFATVSNVAYIASGCYHNFYNKPRSGSLANPAFPLLFLGVSSFAFHEEPVGHQQKHSFDIIGGLIVVLHLACAAIAAVVTELFSEIEILQAYTGWVDYAFVGLFSAALLVLEVFYSQIYGNQLLFYMVCVGVVVVLAFTIRARLSKCRPCMQRAVAISVGIALFESVMALGVAISAVFLQGELLGKKLSYSTNNELYNLFHGFWHLQLGLTVSLLHVRFADVLQQTTEPVNNQSHITELAVLDAFGLTAFFLQASVLLVMKEGGASVGSIQVVLYAGSVLHAVHIGRLVYITYRKQKPTSVASPEAPADVVVRPLLKL